MADPTPTGLALRALKATTGLSWDRLANVLGASSGDYVRKVAAGQRPGRNLAPNVEQFGRAGRVSRAVPRRTTREGTPAAVRGPAGTRAIPQQQQLARRVRGQYSVSETFTRGGRGRIVHVESPRSEGRNRDRARASVLEAVAQAQREGKRVRFTLYRVDGSQTTIGGQGGYDPGRFLEQAAYDARRPVVYAGGDTGDPFSVLYEAGEEGSGDTDAPFDGIDVEIF